MDANGSSFRLLADAGHWRTHTHTAWHAPCRTLALASERTLEAPVDAARQAAAEAALDRVPRAMDTFGAVARWDAAAGGIVVRSHLPGDTLRLPLTQAPTDLCVGHDGVLVVALPEGLLLHDLRGRFADTTVATPGFTPWRLAAAAEQGVYVLERATARLLRLTGQPLPLRTPPADHYAPGVFRPVPENCRPPRLDALPDVPFDSGETAIALAFDAAAGLAVLSWVGEGQPRLRRLNPAADTGGPGPAPGTHAWSAPLTLDLARYAYAFSWLDADRIAVRMPGRRDAPAFDAALPGFGAQAAAGEGTAATADVTAAFAAPVTRPPLGDIFPLATGAQEAPFVHRLAGAPHVPLDVAAAEPLFALSLRNLARQGEATHWSAPGGVLAAHLLDGGAPGTVWHRLFAEAAIPPGTGFIVWLAATAEAQPPAAGDVPAWQPHAFGTDMPALAPDLVTREVPRAAWDRAPSELPGHPGLAPWTCEPGRRGLFSLLIQHSGQRVRKLVGRYLWVRVTLYGDGRSTPEIAALRAYAGRFDYVDKYLPRLYRESLFGAPAQVPGEALGRLSASAIATLDAGVVNDSLRAALAGTPLALSPAARVRVEQPGQRWRLHDDARGTSWPLVREQRVDGSTPVTEVVPYRPRATPADFLSRLLANFEGVLTALEDRVAAAHLLTDPATIPESRLDWLAAWVGVAFDPALPVARRRAWLSAAAELARWHGTRRGLGLALDIATGGGVRGGEIVVVEDFRLRRTLATLLGVDLADEDDPLLPGVSRSGPSAGAQGGAPRAAEFSGNSVVGDTLILGDAERVELLALFRDEVTTVSEDEALRAFFGRLAHRVTVLVHQEVEPQDLGLIRRIAEIEAPAHVEVRVATATWPFMVGVGSLVGVDTYLGPPPPRRPVRVQVSSLGMGDLVLQPAALDRRLTGVAAPILGTS